MLHVTGVFCRRILNAAAEIRGVRMGIGRWYHRTKSTEMRITILGTFPVVNRLSETCRAAPDVRSEGVCLGRAVKAETSGQRLSKRRLVGRDHQSVNLSETTWLQVRRVNPDSRGRDTTQLAWENTRGMPRLFVCLFWRPAGCW